MREATMSDNNNNNNDDGKALHLPPQDKEGSNDNNGSNNGNINAKKILQDLKAEQEQFYSRISKIAQSELAASPPYNEQFQRILQNSSKRIADIDKELKSLENKEEEGAQQQI
jgi:hypothetical protein